MPPEMEEERLPNPFVLKPLSMDCSADSPSGFSLSTFKNMLE
jgi:hypothetical protein